MKRWALALLIALLVCCGPKIPTTVNWPPVTPVKTPTPVNSYWVPFETIYNGAGAEYCLSMGDIEFYIMPPAMCPSAPELEEPIKAVKDLPLAGKQVIIMVATGIDCDNEEAIGCAIASYRVSAVSYHGDWQNTILHELTHHVLAAKGVRFGDPDHKNTIWKRHVYKTRWMP